MKACAALSEHESYEVDFPGEDAVLEQEEGHAEEAAEIPVISEVEPFESSDIFVEVGDDAVTYISLDSPDERLRAVITDRKSVV